MNIRSARIDDQEALFNLYRVLSTKYEDDIDSLKKALVHPTTEVFVLEEDSQLVGTATLSHRALPHYGLVGSIDDIVVDPHYRQRGFGTKLTVHCINVAKQKGCKRIELTSRPFRTEANQMYTKLGFKQRETNAYVLKI